MRRCPQCQAEFPDNYRFCQHDRTPLVDSEETVVTPRAGEPVEATTSVEREPSTSSQTTVAQQALEWAKGHLVLLGVLAGVVIVLFVVYQVFIKRTPESDGENAAVPFKQCQDEYKISVDKTYQSFIAQFSPQNYANRSDAELRLNNLLSDHRETYQKCTNDAETKFEELSAPYVKDPEDFNTFSRAFEAAGGVRKSMDKIEAASSLSSSVNEKLTSIRASHPDSQRIISDLLGKTMDGWNFANASEFKNVKVASSDLNGDVLVMRTHLQLEDFNSKEPRFAVLEMTYFLNSNGEWDFQNFTELLFTKPDVNYLIGNEIFLVGRWRWSSNYATYNQDGSWTGVWDDGSQAGGNWRIVNGNLVLTRNGQAWTNTKIVSFTKRELIIGETTLERAEKME